MEYIKKKCMCGKTYLTRDVLQRICYICENTVDFRRKAIKRFKQNGK